MFCVPRKREVSDMDKLNLPWCLSPDQQQHSYVIHKQLRVFIGLMSSDIVTNFSAIIYIIIIGFIEEVILQVG